MKVQVEFQEPDKKKKIKRIIAREGLAGIVLLSGLASLLISTHYKLKSQFYFDKAKTSTIFKDYWFTQELQCVNISSKLWTISQILLGIYLTYLLIRFIIWAVKTLRDNK